MVILEMLTKIGPPERTFPFGCIVNFNQIFNPAVPISGEMGEFFARETTGVGREARGYSGM